MSEDVSVVDGGAAAGAEAAPLPVPWPPLVSVATNTLYSCTPFRRLGLAALAGPRDIQRRLEQLRLSVELGAPDFGWAFAPNPPPTAEQLRDSSQQLKDSLTRLLHEFFWFWPANYPEEGGDEAMDLLLAGDADGAFLRWQNDASAGKIVAVHNLAIFHQLAALETERTGGALGAEITEWWEASISQWAQVRANDEFWNRFHLRILKLADPRLPKGLLEAMRATLPDAFCAIHASLAINRAQKSQWHEASAHVRFARQVHDVPARAARALEGAIAKVVQGVDLLLRDTVRRMTNDGSVGLALTASLLGEAADELEMIEAICGRDSDVYREVSTRVVDAALEGIISYQRRTLDSCGVLPWLTHLTTLVATPEVRRRLEETADILHGNAIVEKLPPAEPGADPAAGEAEEFEAAYRLLVEEFVPGAKRLELGDRAKAEYLANVRRALRELAHAACYQLENFDLATRALATAAEISDGAERASLSQEREQLLLEIVRRKARELAAEHARAAAETAALTEAVIAGGGLDSPAPDPGAGAETPPPVLPSLPMAAGGGESPVQSELALWSEAAGVPVGEAGVEAEGNLPAAVATEGVPLRAFGSGQFNLEDRGHGLEMNPTRLAFDGVAIAPEELTGIRYGVVDVDTPNGPGRYYRVSWCNAETVVSLDETNLLDPTAPESAQRYDQILETLYGVAVPALIVRLVEWVQAGQTVALGGAQLRREGFAFSGRTFHWPIEASVPYSELAHALDGGEFVVQRAGDENVGERFALVEIWNAAIAGHVIDALASSTPTPEEQ